jgi:glycogen operon protein
VRAYWRGEPGKLPELASRLTASADLFDKRGRKPWASVNFLTAHDGFTLKDLVSNRDKHNQANGENNRDGHSNNYSENCGVEGPTDDPAITGIRLRQMRNMLATLLLARGTPMLLAGDEFGRTQGGNNNAYCQDNEMSWLDWEGIDEKHESLARFTQRLIAIRRALPMLRRGRFLTGQQDEELGVKDVTWITPGGNEMTPDHWTDENARCIGILLDGRAQETGIRRVGTDATLLLVTNAHHDVVRFTLPFAPGGEEWVCLVDTNHSELDSMPRFRFGHVYEVTGRSLLLFMLRPGSGIRSGGEADQSFDHVVDVLQRLTDGRKIQRFALSARSRGGRFS